MLNLSELLASLKSSHHIGIDHLYPNPAEEYIRDYGIVSSRGTYRQVVF